MTCGLIFCIVVILFILCVDVFVITNDDNDED